MRMSSGFCALSVAEQWLNTVLQAVSGNSRDGACFKLYRGGGVVNLVVCLS